MSARIAASLRRLGVTPDGELPADVRDPLALEHAPPAPDSRPAATTREQIRSRRKRPVRARTISTKRMTKRELELGRMLYPPVPEDRVGRPRTRGECCNVERPCPYITCRYNLYLDVSPSTGAYKLNYPDLEVWEMGESCALDVADRGGETLETVGEILNVTRERIRQLEGIVMAKAMPALAAMLGPDELAARSGPDGRRHLPVFSDDDDGDAELEELGDDEEDFGLP